jgi:hypothetical protein
VAVFGTGFRVLVERKRKMTFDFAEKTGKGLEGWKVGVLE